MFRHLLAVPVVCTALLAGLSLLPLAQAEETGEASAAGLAAVSELGQLNGLALACAQPALVTRARGMVIDLAPKTRRYGEAFESATSQSFIAQGKGEIPCPDGKTLAERLDQAARQLKAAFPQGNS